MMAQWNIRHRCGHIQTHQLYGRTAEREHRATWLKNTVCDDCKRAQEQEELDKNDASREPMTNGSEKQITWARKIRDEFISSVEAFREEKIGEATEEQAEFFTETIARVVDRACRCGDACWWIDNREKASGKTSNLLTEWYNEALQR